MSWSSARKIVNFALLFQVFLKTNFKAKATSSSGYGYPPSDV